jgi:hypothetical protein
MRYLLISLLFVMVGCDSKKIINTTPKAGSCYAYSDEAIKVLFVTEDRYFYRHSWNSQEALFNHPLSYFSDSAKEIPCGKDGYEFEVLSQRVEMAEGSIKYLKEVTHPLREKWFKSK